MGGNLTVRQMLFASESEKDKFLKEFNFKKQLKHANLVELLTYHDEFLATETGPLR